MERGPATEGWSLVACLAGGQGRAGQGTSMSGNAVVCFVSFAKTINDAPWLRFWAQAVGFLQLLKLKRKKKKQKSEKL